MTTEQSGRITPEEAGKARADVFQTLDITTKRIQCYPALRIPKRKRPIVIGDDNGNITPADSYDAALKIAQGVVDRWRKELKGARK